MSTNPLKGLLRQLGPQYEGFAQTETTDSVRFQVKFGQVARVDYEKGKMDVIPLDGGSNASMPISAPGWGPRSFFGMMPEVGSFAVLIYMSGSNLSEVPVAATYLPNQYKQALMGDPTFDFKINDFLRPQMRKVLPGEILALSAESSEMHLSRDILLSNSLGNELQLRSEDQSFLLSILNSSISTAAGFFRSGLPIRNFTLVRGPNSQQLQDVVGQMRSLDLPPELLPYLISPDASPLLNVTSALDISPEIIQDAVDENNLNANLQFLKRQFRDTAFTSQLETFVRKGLLHQRASSSGFVYELDELSPIVLPSGKHHFVVTRRRADDGTRPSLDEGGVPWTEHSLKMREVHDGVLDSNPDITGIDTDFLIKNESLQSLLSLMTSDPELFKSAVNDDGTFSSSTPDIMLRGDDVSREALGLQAGDLPSLLEQAQKNSLYISASLGTLIGEDETVRAHYGKVLRRETFKHWGWDDSRDNPVSSSPDFGTRPAYVAIAPGQDVRWKRNPGDEDFRPQQEFVPQEQLAVRERTLGEAVSFELNMSDRTGPRHVNGPFLTTSLNINKEGKIQASTGSSGPTDPVAEGISLEWMSEGAIKAFIGKATNFRPGTGYQKFDTDKGEFSAQEIRNDQPEETYTSPYNREISGLGTSANLVLDRSLNLNIQGPDQVFDALNIRAIGNANSFIDGNKKEHVTASSTTTVDGDLNVRANAKTEVVEGGNSRELVSNGSKQIQASQTVEMLAKRVLIKCAEQIDQQFGTDMTQIIGGSLRRQVDGEFVETVQGKKLGQYGAGMETNVVGSENHIVSDSRSTSIGGREDISVGNVHSTIVSGVAPPTSLSPPSPGLIERRILVNGDILDQTTSGNITYSTLAGNALLQASLTALINAPRVELGFPGAPHPLVKGDSLLTFLVNFVVAYNAHTHGSPSGATTPPATPSPLPTAALLSSISFTSP
jgi:hypothetical protein